MKQFIGFLEVDEKVSKDELRAGLILLRDSIKNPGIQIRVEDIETLLKPKHAKHAINVVQANSPTSRKTLNGSFIPPKRTRWQKLKAKLGFGPSILLPKGFKKNW